MISTAQFSTDRVYRYDLLRKWNQGNSICTFVLLNPSTADEFTNDPTVARCQKRAQMLGFDGVRVLNVFAYRSTDPKKLREVSDPIGAENDGVISFIMGKRETKLVICGWGMHAGDRGRRVLELIRNSGKPPHALGLNSDGSPQHPLYLSYAIKPFSI